MNDIDDEWEGDGHPDPSFSHLGGFRHIPHAPTNSGTTAPAAQQLRRSIRSTT